MSADPERGRRAVDAFDVTDGGILTRMLAALEASGYPDEVDRLRADLDRALDALAVMLRLFDTDEPSYRTDGEAAACDVARAVLADHRR